MPELSKDAPASPVHRLGHQRPCLDLLRQPNPRHIRVANALRHNRDTLGDDQAGAGTLCVVFDHEFGRDVVRRAA